MTTTYVQVGSLQEFQDRMEILEKNAEEYIQKSMHNALNGNVRTRIIRLTPMSTPGRYAHTYDENGKEIDKRKFKDRTKAGQKASGSSKSLRNSFRCEITSNDEIKIGHTAPYAGYVHEMTWLHGKYWVPGAKHGFTTPGTDAKFVSQVLLDEADNIPEYAVRGLDKRMRDGGIF